ncbi:MAG: hypothetical protein MHM6MM_001123 [Cercozoa sp. M6MM]
MFVCRIPLTLRPPASEKQSNHGDLVYTNIPVQVWQPWVSMKLHFSTPHFVVHSANLLLTTNLNTEKCIEHAQKTMRNIKHRGGIRTPTQPALEKAGRENDILAWKFLTSPERRGWIAAAAGSLLGTLLHAPNKETQGSTEDEEYTRINYMLRRCNLHELNARVTDNDTADTDGVTDIDGDIRTCAKTVAATAALVKASLVSRLALAIETLQKPAIRNTAQLRHMFCIEPECLLVQTYSTPDTGQEDTDTDCKHWVDLDGIDAVGELLELLATTTSRKDGRLYMREKRVGEVKAKIDVGYLGTPTVSQSNMLMHQLRQMASQGFASHRVVSAVYAHVLSTLEKHRLHELASSVDTYDVAISLIQHLAHKEIPADVDHEWIRQASKLLPIDTHQLMPEREETLDAIESIVSVLRSFSETAQRLIDRASQLVPVLTKDMSPHGREDTTHAVVNTAASTFVKAWFLFVMPQQFDTLDEYNVSDLLATHYPGETELLPLVEDTRKQVIEKTAFLLVLFDVVFGDQDTSDEEEADVSALMHLLLQCFAETQLRLMTESRENYLPLEKLHDALPAAMKTALCKLHYFDCTTDAQITMMFFCEVDTPLLTAVRKDHVSARQAVEQLLSTGTAASSEGWLQEAQEVMDWTRDTIARKDNLDSVAQLQNRKVPAQAIYLASLAARKVVSVEVDAEESDVVLVPQFIVDSTSVPAKENDSHLQVDFLDELLASEGATTRWLARHLYRHMWRRYAVMGAARTNVDDVPWKDVLIGSSLYAAYATAHFLHTHHYLTEKVTAEAESGIREASQLILQSIASAAQSFELSLPEDSRQGLHDILSVLTSSASPAQVQEATSQLIEMVYADRNKGDKTDALSNVKTQLFAALNSAATVLAVSKQLEATQSKSTIMLPAVEWEHLNKIFESPWSQEELRAIVGSKSMQRLQLPLPEPHKHQLLPSTAVLSLMLPLKLVHTCVLLPNEYSSGDPNAETSLSDMMTMMLQMQGRSMGLSNNPLFSSMSDSHIKKGASFGTVSLTWLDTAVATSDSPGLTTAAPVTAMLEEFERVKEVATTLLKGSHEAARNLRKQHSSVREKRSESTSLSSWPRVATSWPVQSLFALLLQIYIAFAHIFAQGWQLFSQALTFRAASPPTPANSGSQSTSVQENREDIHDID